MVDLIENVGSSNCTTVFTTYHLSFIVLISCLDPSISAHYEKLAML